MSNDILKKFLSALQKDTMFRFSSLLIYGLYALLCFSNTKLDWRQDNKNVIFSCRFVLYQHSCAVEIPEIPGVCVSKIRALPTNHK